jgi:hypothetical protein
MPTLLPDQINQVIPDQVLNLTPKQRNIIKDEYRVHDSMDLTTRDKPNL